MMMKDPRIAVQQYRQCGGRKTANGCHCLNHCQALLCADKIQDNWAFLHVIGLSRVQGREETRGRTAENGGTNLRALPENECKDLQPQKKKPCRQILQVYPKHDSGPSGKNEY